MTTKRHTPMSTGSVLGLTLPVVRPPHGITIDTHEFHQGFRDALTQIHPHGFDVRADPNEQGIVEIMQNCMEIARENWPNEEQVMRYYAGLISGWVYRLSMRV